MKIGILKTGEVSPELKAPYGDYPAMFVRRLAGVASDLEFAVVRVVAGELPAAPEEADAWLITGSRHGVYDDLPWIGPLKDFVRACVAARVPVVGICFGHQLLAEALGGRSVKSEAGWQLGLQEYDVTARAGWMAGLPDRFALRAVHQDQVVALPPSATVLASSPGCPYAALAFGDPERPLAISVQPHPEFDSDYTADLLALRAGTVFPAAQVAEAQQGLSREADNDAWARAIMDYLRVAVRRGEAQNWTG